MRFLPTLLLLALPSFGQLPSAKPVPRVQAMPLPHHVTSFQVDGREVTACHFDPLDMRPFWHPILTSKGVGLTRMGHPHDPLGHSHHNSVWVTHSNVNGLNFWGDRSGEKQGRIINVEVSKEGYQDTDTFASMRMVNHWINDVDKSVQAIEVRRTEVRPLDGAKSWMMIIDLEYSPPKGGRTVFNPSAFGLMAVRVAKSICVHDGGGRLLNSEGQEGEKEMFRLPARWVDYSGRITNDDDGFAGITLMNHPMNPENPTPFHVREDGWMGACLNMHTPIEVTEEKKLRLRYALWVHDGVPTVAEADERWQAFVEMPVVDLWPKPARKAPVKPADPVKK